MWLPATDVTVCPHSGHLSGTSELPLTVVGVVWLMFSCLHNVGTYQTWKHKLRYYTQNPQGCDVSWDAVCFLKISTWWVDCKFKFLRSQTSNVQRPKNIGAAPSPSSAGSSPCIGAETTYPPFRPSFPPSSCSVYQMTPIPTSHLSSLFSSDTPWQP